MNTVTVFVGLLLALTPWPFFPLSMGKNYSEPFRKVRMGIVMLWLIWVAMIVVLAIVNPSLLKVSGAFVVVAAAFFYWRNRDGYGGARGLPKGSLALSRSLLAVVDREYYMKAADRYGPIFKMSQFFQPTICVLGLERGHRLFREHKESFGPVSQPFNRSVAGGFLRYMDNDTHAVYARLFSKALAHPVLAEAVPDVGVLCTAVMEKMAGACLASNTADVSPRKFCEQVSYDTFARVLFGIKPGSDAYAALKAAYVGLDTYDIGSGVDKRTERSLARLRIFLDGHAASLINNPGTASRCTLTELHRLDDSMPDQVCVDNLLFIFKISTANVASLLLWLFKMLGENPAWMQRIIDAGQTGAGDTQTAVIDSVVNETLRLAQSEYLYRKLLKDVQFEGMRLPKGWLVRLCVWESHRSVDSFERPTEFDPERFLRRKIGVTEFAPFGYGAHGCNGIALTEIICRALLERLAKGFDWSITEDGPLERGFRHWNHWQPSPALRIQMAVRTKPG